AHREDLWQLCRDELTGVDVRVDGWDIRGPLVRRGGRGHAAARGVAAWRDDSLARDRGPTGATRTPQLALTRCSPALTGGALVQCSPAQGWALAAQPRPVDFRRHQRDHEGDHRPRPGHVALTRAS